MPPPPAPAAPALLYLYEVVDIVGEGPDGVQIGDIRREHHWHGWRRHWPHAVFDGTTTRKVGVVKTRYRGKTPNTDGY
jgi:hypothetical protein